MRDGRHVAFIGMITGIAVGAVITVPAILLAAASAGAGHGDYAIARLLYPYSMLLTRFTGDRISALLIALALAQFPLCGAMIGAATQRPRLRNTVICVITGLHVLAAGACFSGFIPNFS